MATFLLGPGASFITGQNFIVDGGITRKMIYADRSTLGEKVPVSPNSCSEPNQPYRMPLTTTWTSAIDFLCPHHHLCR